MTAMKKRFFIFSLPRSGSAWLSQFLTGQNSYCYHEPLADGGIDNWLLRSDDRPERVIGAIDTSAYLNPHKLYDNLGDCTYFLLLRNPDDIQESLNRNRMGSYDARTEARKLLELHDLPRIRYEKLNDLAYLEDLWGRVIGTEFDKERAKLMIEMRIERDIGLFMRNRGYKDMRESA